MACAGIVVAAGSALAGAGRGILLALHWGERIEIPPPLEIAGRTFDVVDDLVAYTSLSRAEVEGLLSRRGDSFRVEWHTHRPLPRNERWFYQSSRGYLFANAVHFTGADATELAALVPPPARALDFGAGTGNLALALAAAGISVDCIEISALQKDFLRHRVRRHGLERMVRVLDWWEPLERGAYDVVFALDVFEHLDDLRRTLDNELLPSLADAGRLVESSPFVRNPSNPMHHEDIEGLDGILAAHGLRRVATTDEFHVWRRGASGDDGGAAVDSA